MELHRTLSVRVTGATVLAAGIALTVYGTIAGPWGLIVLGGLCVLVGVSALWESMRPWRFVIETDGLDIRRPGMSRLVPWSDIDAIVLARMGDRHSAAPGLRQITRPLFFIVPTSTRFELPLDHANPWDDRPSALLLDSLDVRERLDDIATAIAEHAGDRFHDLRTGAAG